MINTNSILAIIPARSGSKGLPNKNTLNLLDKPLIAWTIEAAKKSKYLDRLILSTDCDKISKIAQKYNCEVPFLRPKNLSTDISKGNDVIMHAIKTIKKEYDIIVVLQPTSPLRTNDDIDLALEHMIKKKALL